MAMSMDQGRRLYNDLVTMQLYWGMKLIMAPAQAAKSRGTDGVRVVARCNPAVLACTPHHACALPCDICCGRVLPIAAASLGAGDLPVRSAISLARPAEQVHRGRATAQPRLRQPKQRSSLRDRAPSAARSGRTGRNALERPDRCGRSAPRRQLGARAARELVAAPLWNGCTAHAARLPLQLGLAGRSSRRR